MSTIFTRGTSVIVGLFLGPDGVTVGSTEANRSSR
jgi:hypothetical protein